MLIRLGSFTTAVAVLALAVGVPDATAKAKRKKPPTTAGLAKRLGKTDKRVADSAAALGKVASDLGGLAQRLTSGEGRVGAAESGLGSLGQRLGAAEGGLGSLGQRLGAAEGGLGSLGQRLGAAEGGLGALVAAAPDLAALATTVRTQLAPGLAAVQTALRDDVTPGLQALETAMDDDVSPALSQLQTATQTTLPAAIAAATTSQEHGVVGVAITPAGGGSATFASLTATSPDVPDDGNAAQATVTVPMVVGSGSFSPGATLSLRAAIRSGESDGASNGPPAGYAGGTLMLTCGGSALPPSDGCDTDNDGTQETPAGGVVCMIGPAPGFDMPVGTATVTAPVVPIQLASDRDDRTKPSLALGSTTVNPLAAAPGGVGRLVDDAADGCKVGKRPLDIYTLTVQTHFYDPPTSASPGPTE